MLTGLKVSSLACSVFYRPEHNAKVGPHGIEFWRSWNIQTDWAQRVDEKNGIICLLFVVAPGVIVIKMSKMTDFFIFSGDDSKKPVTNWVKYLSASERYH